MDTAANDFLLPGLVVAEVDTAVLVVNNNSFLLFCSGDETNTRVVLRFRVVGDEGVAAAAPSPPPQQARSEVGGDVLFGLAHSTWALPK